MKSRNFLPALLLVGMFLFVSCTSSMQKAIPPEKQCTTAADCVKAQCCHAADAVNKAYAPDCSGVFCTMECKPGTMDCGQGEMQCIQGKCTAVINE